MVNDRYRVVVRACHFPYESVSGTVLNAYDLVVPRGLAEGCDDVHGVTFRVRGESPSPDRIIIAGVVPVVKPSPMMYLRRYVLSFAQYSYSTGMSP